MNNRPLDLGYLIASGDYCLLIGKCSQALTSTRVVWMVHWFLEWTWMKSQSVSYGAEKALQHWSGHFNQLT